MSLRLSTLFCFLTAGLFPIPSYGFLGTELGPLLQLVSGQVKEIERLSESVGLQKQNIETLRSINDGIDRTVGQIQAIERIVDRAKGVDPTAVRTLSDLNDLVDRAQSTQAMIDEVLELKIALADQAILEGSLQSDTAYKMGQEMVLTGSTLAQESQTASPGRANQISAAAASAQMMSQGVELQTLSHVAELQALLLEFQKSQLAKELRLEKLRNTQFEYQLDRQRKRRKQA